MYRDVLEFNIKSGIKTVYSFLKSRGASGLLEDPDIQIATKEIYDGSRGKKETQKVLSSIPDLTSRKSKKKNMC